MLPTTRDTRPRRIALAIGLILALTGCGTTTVGARARDGAEAGLASQLTRTYECLQQQGSALRAAGSDTAALTTALMDCAGTTVLNLDDEGVRTVDRLYRILGSAALSGGMVDGDLLLTMLTEESAVVQSGVTSERVTLATCWQVTIDERGQLGAPSGVACSDALIARLRPTEVLDLEEIRVSLPASRDEAG